MINKQFLSSTHSHIFADYKTRKQVNVDQMSGLLEFLQKHPDLARGLVRGRRGKFHSLDLWNRCAKKLNPVKDGAFKDGKGWSKVTCVLCLEYSFTGTFCVQVATALSQTAKYALQDDSNSIYILLNILIHNS